MPKITVNMGNDGSAIIMGQTEDMYDSPEALLEITQQTLNGAKNKNGQKLKFTVNQNLTITIAPDQLDLKSSKRLQTQLIAAMKKARYNHPDVQVLGSASPQITSRLPLRAIKSEKKELKNPLTRRPKQPEDDEEPQDDKDDKLSTELLGAALFQVGADDVEQKIQLSKHKNVLAPTFEKQKRAQGLNKLADSENVLPPVINDYEFGPSLGVKTIDKSTDKPPVVTEESATKNKKSLTEFIENDVILKDAITEFDDENGSCHIKKEKVDLITTTKPFGVKENSSAEQNIGAIAALVQNDAKENKDNIYLINMEGCPDKLDNLITLFNSNKNFKIDSDLYSRIEEKFNSQAQDSAGKKIDADQIKKWEQFKLNHPKPMYPEKPAVKTTLKKTI